MFLDWAPGDSHMFLPQQQQQAPKTVPVRAKEVPAASKAPLQQ